MIEKIKNFMNSSNTTDLVSYSDEDDYSNFWKDLKPIKYESPIEILKKYVDNFNTNSPLSAKYRLNIEILFPITIENYLVNSEETNCYSIEELKKELNRVLYSERFKTIITNIVTYYTYL